MSTNDDTIEWRLSTYRFFCEMDDHVPESGRPLEEPTTETTTTTAAPNGVWQTRRDHTAAQIFVRFSASLAHLTIIQGTEVLESIFLILAKKWIKAVIIDDEILLYIRQNGRVRRLRLGFPSAKSAQSCYAQLGGFISVKQPLEAADDNNDEDTQVAHWLESILSGGSNSAMAAAAWQTEWPTEHLTDLVKLCLLDSNFPGFVRQVHQAVSVLTFADQEQQPTNL